MDNSLATTLSTISKIYSLSSAVSVSSSLADLTKLTRVEPHCIISRDCANLEYMPDIMQSILAIFSSYYLQAVEIGKIKILDIKVIRLLDSLNPNRDETGLIAEFSNEVYNNTSLEDMKFSLPTKRFFSLEDSKESIKNLDVINELSNLSVGKLLNVSISLSQSVNKIVKDKNGNDVPVTEEKPYTLTIPINIRLIASVLPTPTAINVLTRDKEDDDISERFYKWKAGRISFIKDLIFCQDLIDEYKKTLAEDDTGVVSDIFRRVNNSKKYGLITQNPSLNTASNIVVITQEAAKEIESKFGGKLSNANIRNKIFQGTYSMILVVINTDFDRVTFYIRNLATGSDMSIKEIKTAAKGKGPDILDIFKAMSQGMTPTF